MHHKTLAFSLAFSVNHLFEGKPTITKQSDKQLHTLQNKWKIVSAFQATVKKLQRNIIRIKLTSSSSFRDTMSKNLGNLSRWIMLSNNTRYWVLTLSLSASSSAFIFIQNIIIVSLYQVMEQYFIALHYMNLWNQDTASKSLKLGIRFFINFILLQHVCCM